MNGSKGNAAFNASEHPERRDIVLSLNTAHRMLPLVQRVVGDIMTDRQELDRLQPEQDRLDRQRRDLVWQERRHRYLVHEQVSGVERHMCDALEELDELGLTLLEPETGRIGFPTLVNDRPAFFSWKPGEETLRSWQFAEEDSDRPIPESWWRVAEETFSGKN